jgi:hypothetical protein
MLDLCVCSLNAQYPPYLFSFFLVLDLTLFVREHWSLVVGW